MPKTVTPFLMFTGACEEALEFYVATLKDASINSIERWGKGEPGTLGTIKQGRFSLCGRDFIAIDSPSIPDFDFTPSFSLFVDFKDEAELDDAYEKLSKGGAILMPLQDWGFSKKFSWINDRFGVSWQLNLPHET